MKATIGPAGHQRRHNLYRHVRQGLKLAPLLIALGLMLTDHGNQRTDDHQNPECGLVLSLPSSNSHSTGLAPQPVESSTRSASEAGTCRCPKT